MKIKWQLIQEEGYEPELAEIENNYYFDARAVKYLQDGRFRRRLELIIYEDAKVSSVEDIHRVFQTDMNTPFKTVFEWGL